MISVRGRTGLVRGRTGFARGRTEVKRSRIWYVKNDKIFEPSNICVGNNDRKVI